MNENKKTKKVILIIFLIGISLNLLGCLLANLWYDNSKNTKSKDKTYIHCYNYSQDLVKEKLKSPKSADFPMYDESFITDKGNKIIITAFVDAENSFGATKRTNYIATINIKNNEPDSGVVTIIE